MLRTSATVIGRQGIPLTYRCLTSRAIQRSLLSTTRNLSNETPSDKTDAEILKDIKGIKLKDIKIKREGQPEEVQPEITEEESSRFTNWKTIGIFSIVSTGAYIWASEKKKELEIIKEAEANRSTVGGTPFKLTDFNGKPFTEKDLLGKFTLMYFGFSHCPDICPAELDKLSVWIEGIKKHCNVEVQPIFITCDPIRDTPEVLKKYLKDFHPSMIGLTGSHADIKEMCKNYKVFFSTPEDANPKSDYIVDHSTFTYIIDPEGQFIEAIGTIYNEKEGLERIEQHIKTFVPQKEREKRLNKWYAFLFK